MSLLPRGRSALPPAPVSDPPRSRAPASRSRAPPRRLPSLAPQDLRTRWESTGRSPRPADALVPALGCLGLGSRAHAGSRTRARTDTDTRRSSGGESPPFVVVRPQPASPCWGHSTGLGVESKRTPHPSHMAHWHLSPCFSPSLAVVRGQREGPLKEAGSGRSGRERGEVK